MDGHLSLLILEICPYHFILLFRTVFSAISCPVLTRTSTLLTLSVYLMRSIRRNHRFSHAFSLFSMAVVKRYFSYSYKSATVTCMSVIFSYSYVFQLLSVTDTGISVTFSDSCTKTWTT